MNTPPRAQNNRAALSTVYTWMSRSFQYLSSFVYSSSVAVENHDGSLDSYRNKFFDRFGDSFEEQFMVLASSAGLSPTLNSSSNGSEAEYSMHGVYVPGHIEDWTTFTASLPDSAYPRYKMVLPKKTKVLALDLDETLVHSTCKSSSDCDYFVEVLIDRSSCLYYVFKRPFVDRFLDTASAWYHLVIYTASLREYAEPVVNWLDRGRGLFKKRLFRTVWALPATDVVGLLGTDGALCKESCLGGS